MATYTESFTSTHTCCVPCDFASLCGLSEVFKAVVINCLSEF